MNTKNKNTRSVGRPAAELVWPRGIFTIDEAFELNKKAVKWPLTVRQHVVKALANKTLTLLKDTVQTGKPGRPASKLIRTAVWKALKTARKARGNVNETAIPLTEVVDASVSVPVVVATPEVAMVTDVQDVVIATEVSNSVVI